jgi:hypothetical protein
MKKTNSLYDRIEKMLNESVFGFITKEQVCKKLKEKDSNVSKIFMQMNREGKLTQAKHNVCNDSLQGKSKCWHPDTYLIIKKEKNHV